MSSSIFDRSFLREAAFEFVVISDTHYMLRPEIYASGGDSQDARFTQQWSARAARALQLAAALEASLTIHLGDLAQEYPGTEDFAESRREACRQIAHAGLKPYYAPGNMDIGDKPNLAVPAEWVTPDSLAGWHEQFGRSWYSFDHNGLHFIVLNSQIMKGPLPEAGEQEQWFELDLAKHEGRRIFLFLHMPPFFVDEGEAGFGHYNSLDEMARGWLLPLLRRYKVEMVFSGHTHFAALNRVDGTRLWVVPSTTTSRAGFYEVFSTCPPDRGRNDVAKLGFFLVRVCDDRATVHLVRTNGEIGLRENTGAWRRLVTRTSQDLPASPVGVYLRLPIANIADGVIAWPDVVRQRVRNDYPLLCCLELGVRHLRVPLRDLEDPVQRGRLAVARDEAIQVIGVWPWSNAAGFLEAVRPHVGELDAVEVQVPGTLTPGRECLEDITRCAQQLALPVTVAPLLASERVRGKFHPRTRIGYRKNEISDVNGYLREQGVSVGRVLCCLDGAESPWDSVQEFTKLLPLSHIGSLDFVFGLSGDELTVQVNRTIESVFAAALLPGCRMFLDPLIELDRTSDTSPGLLDRLSNPGPAFHAVRCLNTLLFGVPQQFTAMAVQRLGGWRVLGLKSAARLLWLLLPDGPEALSSPPVFRNLAPHHHEVLCFDLCAGMSGVSKIDGSNLLLAQAGTRGPLLLLLETGARERSV